MRFRHQLLTNDTATPLLTCAHTFHQFWPLHNKLSEISALWSDWFSKTDLNFHDPTIYYESTFGQSILQVSVEASNWDICCLNLSSTCGWSDDFVLILLKLAIFLILSWPDHDIVPSLQHTDPSHKLNHGFDWCRALTKKVTWDWAAK